MLKNVKMFCALLAATRTERGRTLHLLAPSGVRRRQFKMLALSVRLTLRTHRYTLPFGTPLLTGPFGGCLLKCSHKYVKVRYVSTASQLQLTGLSGCTHSVA